MRKFYSLLLLAVMFIAGTSVVNAEKRYGIDGGNVVSGYAWTIDDAKPGKQFVMQSGAEGGANPDFICGLSKSTFLTDANLFELVDAGENAEGIQSFNLKRVATGEFLAAGTFTYDKSQARAWKFIIREAVTYSTDDVNMDPSECPVDDWTSATTYGGAQQPQLIFADAECSVEDTAKTNKRNVWYLCSGGTGKAPAFGRDLATNTWELFDVVELTGVDYLNDAITEIFPDGDPELYNCGTEPGQISKELYDELIGSFNAVQDMINANTTDQAACEKAIERCRKAIEAAKEGAVKVQEGYYYFKSSRNTNNATYDDGEGLHWTWRDGWEKPEVLNMENAKYVWYLKPNMKDGKADGSYFIQNFYTKRYIGVVHEKGKHVKTTVDPEEPYLIYPQDKEDFVIESISLIKDPAVGYDGVANLTALHCPDDHDNVVVWTADAPASGWVFLNVKEEEVKALEGQIAQDRLNKQLEKVYNQAKADYDKGCCYFDGNPNGLLDMMPDSVTAKGLVTDVNNITTNRQEESEGNISNILDNKVVGDNYFHSDWHGTVNANQLPYLQIKLSEAVNHVVVKMWARVGADGENVSFGFNHNIPAIVNVWGSNTPEDSASWVKTGQFRSAMLYNFPVSNAEGKMTGKFYNNKAVAQLDANLGETKYSNIRLEVERTNGNVDSKEPIDTAGTFFNMSEIRVFKYQYIPEKSMVEAVDETIRTEFLNAMDAAKKLLDSKTATEEAIKNLEAAYEKFMDNYPDPEIVKRALADAQSRMEASEEGEGLGYYKTGAKAEFEAALNAVAAKVKDIMSLEEVKTCKAEIDAAVKAFNSKLNKPADGYYYLRSETGSTQESAAAGAFFYASGNSARVKWQKSDELTLEYLPQYVWKLTNKGDSITLQNVLTGEYMNNPKNFDRAVRTATVADTCAFGLQADKTAGFFNIVLKESLYLNAEPGSHNLVTWGEAGGSDNSSFSFVPVSEQGISYEGTLSWNVTPNEIQIITLPVTVTAESGTGEFYSVKGINGDKLELTTITGDITAGTPFFYKETEGLSDMQVPTPGISSFADFEGKAAKEALNVNGLFGTLAPIDSLHPGYGILYNQILVDSKVGEGVNNNSGYIAPSVPRVTEAGDFQITVEGKITAINNVVNPTTPAIVNVYNLSGVKVRSNVKSTKDLNGLPAGIYIMGNKKVLVK